jgi:hypothetical protein
MMPVLTFLMCCSALAAADTLMECDFSSENWFKQFNASKKSPKVTGLDFVERVVDSDRKKFVLKVRFPKGSFDLQEGGAYWRTYLKRPVERATISYDFKFEKDFGFALGGKLPGLAGGGKEKSPDDFVAGGEKPTGTNGWSSRFMWREDGQAENYAYYFNMPTTYGRRFPWKVDGEPLKLSPGKWYHVESQVVLNDPDQENGTITTWLDGKRVMKAEKLRFRTVERLKIDSVHFSTFFGGDTLDWAPKKDEAVYFDAFKVIGE